MLEAVKESVEQEEVQELRVPNVRRIVMMLFGLAAENLIKAIVVAKGSVITSEGAFPKWFKRHDLLALAERANLPVSHYQKHLLKRLQEFVKCGKYPVGLREGQGRSTWVSFESIDWNDALQLLSYLEGELERASGGYVVACPNLRGLRIS